ncbi:MAG: hypothetical protein ACRDZ3_23710 [Acidimicrobiia bacterium]
MSPRSWVLREVADGLKREALWLSPAGKLALARLLARPDTLKNVAARLATGGGGRPPDAAGFKVDDGAMRRVVAGIAADPVAGPVLNEAAGRYASETLDLAVAPFLADRQGRDTQRALSEVGALFGALGSRSYEAGVAVDVAEVGTDAVKDVLEKLAGATLDVVKGGVLASVVVEGGKTVFFTLGGGEAGRRAAERDLAEAARNQRGREELRSRLDASLQHLAFVSLLADPSARAAMHLRLSPADLPAELPVSPTDPTGGVDPHVAGFESVDEWRRVMFDDRGRLVVPDPNDPDGDWGAFLAWAQYVNPDLAVAARKLHDVFNAALRSAAPGP